MFTRAGRSARLVAALLYCVLFGAFHSHLFGQAGCANKCALLQFFNAPAPGGPGGGTDHYAYQFKRADNYQTKQGFVGSPITPGGNQFTTTTTDPGLVCNYAFAGRPPVLYYGEDDTWIPIGPWTMQTTNRQCAELLPYPSVVK